EVNTSIGCSGYKIDIAVVNRNKPSQYILGILCDGNNYYATKTAKDREIIQQDVLRLLGWTVHKVWSTDWWEDHERVIEDILTAIKNAEANEGKEISKNVHEIMSPEPEKSEPVVLNNSSYREASKVTENHLSVNQYNICNLEIVLSSSSNDFLDFANTSKIKNQINQVLEIEAPIKKNLLAKRVLAAWGISKLGSRIKAHFEMLLSQMEIKQTDKSEDVIFWNNTLNSENYEGYRVATINGQKRDAEDIPADEIANGVKEILGNQISLPTEDLIRESSKLFGFARTGTQVELAMKKGIETALKKSFIKEKDGRVLINDL
ncbi:MAG: DUF3320 domain-containing protein, partial [Ginsengibacter sp.]